jgi:hypothetical protein
MLPVLSGVIAQPEALVTTVETHVSDLLWAMRAELTQARGAGALDAAVQDWRGRVEQEPRLTALRKAGPVLGLALDLDRRFHAALDACAAAARQPV